MITASFHLVIESPWTELEPVRLGHVPRNLGTPNLYLTVSVDDQPFLRIDLYGDSEEYYFKDEAIVWSQFIVIGFGQKVYFVPLDESTPKFINLEYYFRQLYPIGNLLLIASGERIFCVNKDGNLQWSSQELGIDGVVIEKVDDNYVYGEGEWDPPGGWKPFQIRLTTGHLFES